jgi:hypothetical protein
VIELLKGDGMPEHTIGTREEWQAARDELAKLEAQQAERNEEIKRKRLELPWVPVEKQYQFDTAEGKKTLAELFDGRSQLLAYNIMFGPDYKAGACPGCTNLGDGLDGSLVHLNHRDVTLICFSRAPIDRLLAYKQRTDFEVAGSGRATLHRLPAFHSGGLMPTWALDGYEATTEIRRIKPTGRPPSCCIFESRHSSRSLASATDASGRSTRNLREP